MKMKMNERKKLENESKKCGRESDKVDIEKKKDEGIKKIKRSNSCRVTE
jgi:hypothetical protein